MNMNVSSVARGFLAFLAEPDKFYERCQALRISFSIVN